MSKEHIEELLRKVSQSNNDDYLALTIGSLFSDMEQQNKRYREAITTSTQLIRKTNITSLTEPNILRALGILDRALESESHETD